MVSRVHLPKASTSTLIPTVWRLKVASCFQLLDSRYPSSLVRTIFTDSSHTSNSNFIGYNCLYGASHCKSYSPHHIAIGNLVREIRSTHMFILHFSHSELEAIVSAVVLEFLLYPYLCTLLGVFTILIIIIIIIELVVAITESPHDQVSTKRK